MVAAKEHAEALRKIQAWLAKEGVSVSKIEKPQEGVEHALVFKYGAAGQVTFNLIRPKGRALTLVVTGVTVSPDHLQILRTAPPELRAKALRVLRRVAFQGGVVGLAPNLQGDLILGWGLDVQVYDDGLTQHNLLSAMRALLTKHIELLDAFNEILGERNGSSTATFSATGSTGYL